MVGNLIQILDSSKNYTIHSSIGNVDFYIKRNGIYIKDNETENIFSHDLERQTNNPVYSVDSVIKVYENIYSGVMENINNSWAFLAIYEKDTSGWKPIDFLDNGNNWKTKNIDIHYSFDQMYGGYLFQMYQDIKKKVGNAKNPEDVEERIIGYFKKIYNKSSQMLLPPPKN